MSDPVKATGFDLFSFLFGGNNALLPIVISLLAVVMTIVKYRQSKQAQLALQCLETVIAPLFELLEPSMMKDAPLPDEQTVHAAKRLISDNLLLAGGKLRASRGLSLSAPAFASDWTSLCKYVSRRYDGLCFVLAIPRRSIPYRVANYKAKFAAFPIALMICEALFNAVCAILSVFLLIAAALAPMHGYSDISVWLIILIAPLLAGYSVSSHIA